MITVTEIVLLVMAGLTLIASYGLEAFQKRVLSSVLSVAFCVLALICLGLMV